MNIDYKGLTIESSRHYPGYFMIHDGYDYIQVHPFARVQEAQEYIDHNCNLIGLSLSLCVDDILHDRVQECEVVKIITGTKAKTDAEFRELIARYAGEEEGFGGYWTKNPARGKAIAYRLWCAHKIEQPKLHGGESYNNLLHARWATQDGLRLTWRSVSDGALRNGFIPVTDEDNRIEIK